LCKSFHSCNNPFAKSSSDTHDLSLSPYQEQFFQGWIRAADAVPPRATFSTDRHGIGPLMSSSRTIDLVQDAASDCSVVTSLCAAIARAERGHDQVSMLRKRPHLQYTDEKRCSQTSFILSTNISASQSRPRMESTWYDSISTAAGER
jgi:hypothetical protein